MQSIISPSLDWGRFLLPESHEVHLEMISKAIARAEEVIDLVKFYYCRIDLTQTLPGRVGYLPRKGFSAGLFYTLEDHESYIVAGEIVTHQIVVGLGLELDNIDTSPDIGCGEIGHIARHGLRMHTIALEAANDTTKFIQMMTLIDYLAEPDIFIGMQDAKKRIGRHVAKDRGEYDEIMEDFKFLTSEGGKPGGSHKGLRHNIVHLGKRLEDLLDKPERQKVLQRLDRYASIVLQDLIERSDKDWDAIITYRKERGVELGLEHVSIS